MGAGNRICQPFIEYLAQHAYAQRDPHVARTTSHPGCRQRSGAEHLPTYKAIAFTSGNHADPDIASELFVLDARLRTVRPRRPDLAGDRLCHVGRARDFLPQLPQRVARGALTGLERLVSQLRGPADNARETSRGDAELMGRLRLHDWDGLGRDLSHWYSFPNICSYLLNSTPRAGVCYR